MRCATCGAEISDANATICPHCGQALALSAAPLGNGPEAFSTPASPQAMEGSIQAADSPWAYPLASAAPEPAATPTPASMAASQQTPRLAGMLAPLPPVRKRPLRAVLLPVIIGVAILAVVGGLLTVLNGQENASLTAAANTTATANAPHTPVPVVAYQNTFTQSANDWPNDQRCFYGAGGYHVSGAVCYAPAGDFDTVDISVTVEQLSGSTLTPHGISLRSVTPDNRYDDVIDSNGKWAVLRCDGSADQNTADCITISPYTANTAISGGLNTPNTIAVSARGSHFDISINGVDVGSFNDSTYSSGKVGLIANTECVFTNLTITRYV